MDSDILLRLLLYFSLLLMSGFFSGSETALFSLSPVQLLKFRQLGKPRPLLVHQLLEQPRRLIATIFIGNEFVNIGASAIMASVSHHYLKDHGTVVVSLVSTAVSVTFILFLGEITPKNLAVRMVEGWSLVAARPLWLLALVMAPLRWLIEKIADVVVGLVARRVRPQAPVVGEDEFLTMLDAVTAGGEVDAGERELIRNVFEFGDRRVTDVMTPASHVFTLSYNLPLERILRDVRENVYSRVPIYQGSRDRIVGLLYLKDLIPVVYKLEGRRRRLQDLLHPAYFVPRSTKCEQLFREFQRRRTHLALVVDEYGHLVGLVTMEDLLEEMFGEIVDEKELTAPNGEHVAIGAAGENAPEEVAR